MGGGSAAESAEGVAAAAEAFAEAARFGELVVIADFDRTITPCFLADGRRCTSSHGVLEQAALLSEAFRDRCKVYFEQYYPIEIDASLPMEEKIPLMHEWYSQEHELMVGEGLTRDGIASAVSALDCIDFRGAVPEFLRLCQEAEPPVPVLIMSAGLADVIEEFLHQRLTFALAPTTAVVSNRMDFDSDGKLVSFSEPVLHMFNKSAAAVPESLQPLLKDKRCCLVIGDSVGDITMADGLDVDTLKVGLLAEDVDKRLQEYLDAFDFVVTGDGPLPDVCFRAIGKKPPAVAN